MQPRVELTRMPQQTAVRCADDDWTGTVDSATRRKLQNRLNQRIYRQRHRATSESLANAGNEFMSETFQGRSVIRNPINTCATEPLSITNPNENHLNHFAQPNITASSSSAGVDVKQWTTGRVSGRQGFAQLRLTMAEFEEEARKNYYMGSPRSDQLLTLIQFNVLRALMQNTQTMGWDLDWLDCTVDPLSPWLNLSSQPVPGAHCPQALCPTPTQRTVPHHPWIDLWPIPQMRDTLLLHDGNYDEDKLCNDLLEFGGLMNEQTGLIVWGEPWDIWGWEVSETFLRNWGWTVKGCEDLLASTNAWRAKRGEEAIVFEV
ncbi:31b8fdc8-d8cc-4f92-a9bc-4f76885e6563 [Sclerotinia trifoliorum]|uniref:31b8fdc8-d8cc-4f92-a9bc-4f76885e6563 n=1 Tax=Sclerotinia trifoliorum TaxID=28548 RepID=A0A8H2VMZ4_9HELO|nr:31b8fdc8-d8cc-4f92-a9bc-4f76885e6563 [Sclerotinia trifoliorum]